MDRGATNKLLVACAVIAVIPLFPWLVAALFESVDDKWLDSWLGLRYSLPAGLGLAAVSLATHGLRLHEELADDLEQHFAELIEQSAARNAASPIADPANQHALVGSTPMTNQAVAAGAEDPDDPAGESAASRMQASSKKAAKKATAKAARRAKTKAKSAARKQMRSMLPKI